MSASITYGTATVSAFDTTTFSLSSGTLSVNVTPFGSLSSDTSLSAATLLHVVEGSAGATFTPYQSTLGSLAKEVFLLNMPSLAISTIAPQITAQPFTETITAANYYVAPALQYQDLGGTFTALPSPTVTGSAPTWTITFTHPGMEAGTYADTVKDSGGISATSNTFAVTSAPSLSLTTPSSGSTLATSSTQTIAGTYFGAAPSGINYEWSSVGTFAAAASFSAASGTWTGVINTPSSAGANSLVVQEANATSITATATSIVTTVTIATAASFMSGVPSAGTVGAPLAQPTVSHTPATATAYAALSNGSTRMAFTGPTYPALTPSAAGTVTQQIFAASSGGTALATSSPILVSGLALPSIGGTLAPALHIDAAIPSSIFADSAYGTVQRTGGGAVAGWADTSGNGNNINNGSAPGTLATNSIGTLSAVVVNTGNAFNGPPSLSNTMVANSANTTGVTIFAVIKYSALTAAYGCIARWTDAGGNNLQLQLSGGSIYMQVYYAAGGWSAASVNAPAPGTLCKLVATTSASGLTLTCNAYATATGVVKAFTPNGTGGLQIGSGFGNGDNLTIYEEAIYLKAASGGGGASPTGDVGNLLSYATSKWGS